MYMQRGWSIAQSGGVVSALYNYIAYGKGLPPADTAQGEVRQGMEDGGGGERPKIPPLTPVAPPLPLPDLVEVTIAGPHCENLEHTRWESDYEYYYYYYHSHVQ